MKSSYVYMLASKPYGALYIGVTSALIQRARQREGLAKGFTQRYGVKRLVWFEEYGDILLAIAREKALKKWLRDWKINLIERPILIGSIYTRVSFREPIGPRQGRMDPRDRRCAAPRG